MHQTDKKHIGIKWKPSGKCLSDKPLDRFVMEIYWDLLSQSKQGFFSGVLTRTDSVIQFHHCSRYDVELHTQDVYCKSAKICS